MRKPIHVDHDGRSVWYSEFTPVHERLDQFGGVFIDMALQAAFIESAIHVDDLFGRASLNAMPSQDSKARPHKKDPSLLCLSWLTSCITSAFTNLYRADSEAPADPRASWASFVNRRLEIDISAENPRSQHEVQDLAKSSSMDWEALIGPIRSIVEALGPTKARELADRAFHPHPYRAWICPPELGDPAALSRCFGGNWGDINATLHSWSHDDDHVVMPPSHFLEKTGTSATMSGDEFDSVVFQAVFAPGRLGNILIHAIASTSWETAWDGIQERAALAYDQMNSDLRILLQRLESPVRLQCLDDLLPVDLPTPSEIPKQTATPDSPIPEAFAEIVLAESEDASPKVTATRRPKHLSSFAPGGHPGESLDEVSYWIEARASPKAFEALQHRAANSTQTGAWLLNSLKIRSEQDSRRIDDLWSELHGDDRTLNYETIGASWTEDPPSSLGSPQNLSLDGDFMSLAIRSAWTPWTKKDSFERRCRNGFLLANEARLQKHHAVRLSLITSALEAFVGEKRTDLTSLIAQRCSVLLEPEPKLRPACQALIKRIYDRRSRILHGQEPFARKADVEVVRMLLAATIRAVVSHQRLATRLGVDYRPEEFGKELDDHAASGQELLGTFPQLVRMAWGVPIATPDVRNPRGT